MFGSKKLEARARWEAVSIDEIRRFIGANASSFLLVADDLKQHAIHGKKVPLAWCWAAFFFTFAWFAYRKMYATAVILFFFPLLAAIAADFLQTDLPNSSVFIFGTIFGCLAKQFYVVHAQSAILRLREKGAVNEADLVEAGGVSKRAGGVAGVLWCLVTVPTFAPLIASLIGFPFGIAIAR